jgi:hypothetical protein
VLETKTKFNNKQGMQNLELGVCEVIRKAEEMGSSPDLLECVKTGP